MSSVALQSFVVRSQAKDLWAANILTEALAEQELKFLMIFDLT